ncbi:hypothetical protein [Streptomyces sp. NPDC020747]|uniref:hypothetical protein n=1 Tax=Streptomyces sp. NPDC020747 TaxID=3365086 RepID=UPI0037B0143C
MADDFDLNALTRPLGADFLREVEDARRAAEQAPPPPPSTIPMPDFRPGCIARFRCPLECGWHHDESTDPGPMGPLLLPANFTADDLSAAMSSQAEVRGNNFRLRVELAISEHFDAAHPGR